MGDDTYVESPITTRTKASEYAPLGPEHRYIHIDEFSWDVDSQIVPHLYAYESEAKEDEIIETIQTLRNRYVFATGIIWPDEMKPHVTSTETTKMRALEWAYMLHEYEEYSIDDVLEAAAYIEDRINS